VVATPISRPAAMAMAGDGHLRQVNPCNIAAFRAENLQRGDAAAPRFEIGRHAVADADPGDRQRRQRHQHEELPHAPDEAVQPRRCLVARARLEPGHGEARGEGIGQRLGIGGRATGGQADAVLRADHRSGLTSPKRRAPPG
jgi:hypothetical protein